MNIDTGEITFIKDGEQFPENCIPIDTDDMTDKQKETLKVELADHTSVLGKLRGDHAKNKARRKKSRADRKRNRQARK